MLTAHDFLLNLAMALGVAGLAALVCQRLKQPAVAGYLLAGLLVGPHLPFPIFVNPDAVGALSGASDHTVSKSLYARDPDGLEFEVCWCVPAELVDGVEVSPRPLPLDLPREIERFGADTPGRLA